MSEHAPPTPATAVTAESTVNAEGVAKLVWEANERDGAYLMFQIGGTPEGTGDSAPRIRLHVESDTGDNAFAAVGLGLSLAALDALIHAATTARAQIAGAA